MLLNLAGMLAVGLGGYNVVNLPTRPSGGALIARGTYLLTIAERAVWLAEGVLLVCILLGFGWAAKEIGWRLRQRRRVIDTIIDPAARTDPHRG